MKYRTALSAVLEARGLLAATLPSALIALACGGTQPEAAPPPPPPPVEAPVAATPTPPPAATAATTAAAPAPAPEPAPPPAAWRIAEGIQTPESVLYDATTDRYLVSNINGSPVAVDNNGYITEISGDGKVTKAKFIEGGAGKTKLDAPKGLGLIGNVLYVSDITVVRKFDAKTGAPKGEIPIKDSTFLNDIAVAADGRVFVSDSGAKPGANGFEPTGTDAVYVIDKAGKVKTVAKSKDLGGPNGLFATDKGVLVNTLLSDEIYRLNAEGAKEEVTKVPTGGLDGLLVVGDDVLVTSWAGSTIYRGKLGGKFEPVIKGVKGPADMGYDTKRSRVVLPRFVDNAVEAYDLK